MPTEFIGILLEYFLDDPTGDSPQFLKDYARETKEEFLSRFRQMLDEKRAQEIDLEELALETKVFNFVNKQSEDWFDSFIEDQKILYFVSSEVTTPSLPKKEPLKKVTPLASEEQSTVPDIPQVDLKLKQDQQNFELLNVLFKKSAIQCLLPIEKLKQFLKLIPYFYDCSLEELLYLFLQEPQATQLKDVSQRFSIGAKNQRLVFLPSRQSEENDFSLLTHYRVERSSHELQYPIKDKEAFNFLLHQLAKKTTEALTKENPFQKRFEYLAVCFTFGARRNTLEYLEKNSFFLDETDPKILENSLQNILNEIKNIQDKLALSNPLTSKKKKTSQELLHEKIADAEKEQKNKQ